MKTHHPTQKLYTQRALLYQRLFVDFLGWGRELTTFFRRSGTIHPKMKILDAGCGTGVITRVLYSLAQENRYEGIQFHAFDLTPEMLDVFRQWVTGQGASDIELKHADVLEIGELPPHWTAYDLIVSSTMLEYIPRTQVRGAVSNLMQLLRNGGILLAIITRRNLLTRWLAEKWWKTNLYGEGEIQALFREAGFGTVEFKKLSPGWSNSIMVVEAQK